jgi:hypothetical protein
LTCTQGRRLKAQRGASLLGLVVVLFALGIAGVAVVVSLDRNTTSSHITLPTAPGQSQSAGASASPIQAAAAVSCRSNYQAVESALQEYEALNGHPPATLADLRGMLKDPPSSPDYMISIRNGTVDVSTTGHPATPGMANCSFVG